MPRYDAGGPAAEYRRNPGDTRSGWRQAKIALIRRGGKRSQNA